MNTAEIMEKCRTLPGVRVEQHADFTELLLLSADGTGRMRFYPVFPGVTLALIRVSAPVWPAPQPDRCTPDARGPLITNYCTRGRCELILNDNRHVFLTSGQISLTERFAQNEYLYPGKVYEGIEFFIDPDAAQQGVAPLLELFGLDIAALRKTYCPSGETFLANMTLPEALLARLCVWEDAAARLNAVGRKTGSIDFLSLLLSQPPISETARPVYYTKSQVEIAKRTEAIITADLSRQHTAREFAARFCVSESSVKNYFRGVFGQSISQYTTHRRMLLAAELLTRTQLSVIEVSNRVGYVNQSKFAAAFRRAFSCTPLEYRREKHIRHTDL